MMKKIRIVDPGDSSFLIGEAVSKSSLNEINSKLMDEDKRVAIGEPLLLGITKAALSTDSFISAASFQETTKILTEASIQGKLDTFRGLKENVIIGRLIPAGTGFQYDGMSCAFLCQQGRALRQCFCFPAGLALQNLTLTAAATGAVVHNNTW